VIDLQTDPVKIRVFLYNKFVIIFLFYRYLLQKMGFVFLKDKTKEEVEKLTEVCML